MKSEWIFFIVSQKMLTKYSKRKIYNNAYNVNISYLKGVELFLFVNLNIKFLFL